jgi:hypothetical protein
VTAENREFAKKITGYLDQGAAGLRPGLAYRLQQARAEALARLEPARDGRGLPGLVGAHGFAGGGTVSADPTHGVRRSIFVQARFWIGVGVIALVLLGYQQWRAFEEAREIADLDTAILTSDLPIDAYVDRGFQNWLRTADTED